MENTSVLLSFYGRTYQIQPAPVAKLTLQQRQQKKKKPQQYKIAALKESLASRPVQ